MKLLNNIPLRVYISHYMTISYPKGYTLLSENRTQHDPVPSFPNKKTEKSNGARRGAPPQDISVIFYPITLRMTVKPASTTGTV